MNKPFLLAAAVIVICTSCASIQQDMYVSDLDAQDLVSVNEIEKQIILQDGLLLSSSDSGKMKADSTDIIAFIDKMLTNPAVSENARCRLYALKGRALLAEGKAQNAARQLKAARQINPGDPQVLILEYRLDTAGGLDSRRVLSDDAAPLVAEAAIEHYLQGRYAESVAAFDAAFITLGPVYIEAYGSIRNAAWTLKDVNSNKNGKADTSYLSLTEMSAQTFVSIINDFSDLLMNVTGGKKMSEKELFNRLVALNLFTPVLPIRMALSANSPDVSFKTVTPEQIVTRIICARFLWNLYTIQNSKRAQSSAYSAVYGNLSVPESPVPDVPVDSPDFDAVLGCVENEIMELPDGIHFFPEDTFGTADILGWIKNLK